MLLNRAWGRRIQGLIVAILLLVASTLLMRATRNNRELRARLQFGEAQASRTVVHDRLVGMQVPRDLLGHTISFAPDASTESQAYLLWVVDVERCERCLVEGFATWNALAIDHALDRRVIIQGDSEIPPVARRALRGTAVVALPREQIMSVLGPVLPNTKMLLDEKGVVLLADSRTGGSECGWSFDAQVGALRGVLASDLVRN